MTTTTASPFQRYVRMRVNKPTHTHPHTCPIASATDYSVCVCVYGLDCFRVFAKVHPFCIFPSRAVDFPSFTLLLTLTSGWYIRPRPEDPFRTKQNRPTDRTNGRKDYFLLCQIPGLEPSQPDGPLLGTEVGENRI